MITLLKLKYLFFASIYSKMDFKPVLSVINVNACPESIEALISLNLGPGELSVINSLYESMRHIEKKDPLPKTRKEMIPYKMDRIMENAGL